MITLLYMYSRSQFFYACREHRPSSCFKLAHAMFYSFSKWRRGQPDDCRHCGPHAEPCIMLYKNGEWNDLRCQLNAALCEFGKSLYDFSFSVYWLRKHFSFCSYPTHFNNALYFFLECIASGFAIWSDFVSFQLCRRKTQIKNKE